MFIALIIIIPVILIILSLFIRKIKLLGMVNASGYACLLLVCALFLKYFLTKGCSAINLWGWVYIDSLSVFFLLTTTVVSFAASVYSICT